MEDIDKREVESPEAEKVKGTRDDFGTPVRRLLAQQVAYRCSNPKCGAPTIGPSGEQDKIVDLGVAAHITAASRLGPRFDDNLTSEQRRHPDNAIWLCQSCGKLVDSDTSTHTVAQLRLWKEDAIQLARRALAMRDVDPDGRIKLARESRHNAAKAALAAAVKARGQILAGLTLAKRISVSRDVVKAQLDDWMGTSKAAEDEIKAALMEVRVNWGGEPRSRTARRWGANEPQDTPAPMAIRIRAGRHDRDRGSLQHRASLGDAVRLGLGAGVRQR